MGVDDIEIEFHKLVDDPLWKGLMVTAGWIATTARWRRFFAILVGGLLIVVACAPGPASTQTEAGADGRVYFAGEAPCGEPPTAHEVYEGSDAEIAQQKAWYVVREDRHRDVEIAADIAGTNDLFVGSYVDWADREVVMVLDKVGDGPLEAAVDGLSNEVEANTSEVSFRVEIACRSQQELQEIADYISSSEVQETYSSHHVTSSPIPAQGVLRVFIGPNHPELVEHLDEQFGGAVLIDDESEPVPAASSRLNDVPLP